MPRFSPQAFGWWRDPPDFRDYSLRTPLVRQMLADLRPAPSPRPESGKPTRHSKVDLREFFLEPNDQENLNSSPAHACISLVEYFEMRARGKISQPSRLYLYKIARNLSHLRGDTGVNLRTVLTAMVRFGIPPEDYWPYQTEQFDRDPDPYLHAYADTYRSIVYVRLDQRNSTGSRTLDRVKAFLAAGFPSVFGFTIPSSLSASADIPFRPTLDGTRGGQAVVAVGFDDDRIRTSKGALLVRNSWGTDWGDNGYGWLPYGYVEQQLACDFWTILSTDWLASGEFRRPRLRGRLRPRGPGKQRPKAGIQEKGQPPITPRSKSRPR